MYIYKQLLIYKRHHIWEKCRGREMTTDPESLLQED